MADGTARVGGARFDNLTLTLAEAERYTYTFDGRSQAIDHIIANELLSDVATYDVVHLNTGYNANGTGADASPRCPTTIRASSSFDFRKFSRGADRHRRRRHDRRLRRQRHHHRRRRRRPASTAARGNDTAVYAGNVADYAITAEFDGSGNLIGFSQVTDINGGNGDEGTDTLISVETLQFADATLSAARSGPALRHRRQSGRHLRRRSRRRSTRPRAAATRSRSAPAPMPRIW